jgi:transposase-like protein
MAKDSVSAVARRRYWRSEDARVAVEAWDRSGETLAAFGRRHGIKPQRIRRWADRLAEHDEVPTTAESVQFYPVRLVTMEERAHESVRPIEIEFGDRCTLRVPPGFSATDLVRVLQVLERGPGC